MTATPLVSVIIGALNAERFITDAVGSILAQELPIDLIVVNDGSTDNTAREVEKFGTTVRLISLPSNQGLPSALNHGLAAARGELIGFLDADDLWVPGRLNTGLNLLAGSSAEVLWGRTQIVFLGAKGEPTTVSPDWPPRHYPSLGSMLFRKEVFDKVGIFNVDFRHAQDIDWLSRATERKVEFCRYDDVVLTWRRHSWNMTNDVGIDRDYMISAIRAGHHRRRAAAVDETTPDVQTNERDGPEP